MIKVECSNCHNHFFTPPKAAGKSGKCPSCGEVIVVPIPGEPALGPHHDAPSEPAGTKAPRTNRGSSGPSSNGSHANRLHRANETHPADNHNGANSGKAEGDEEKKGLKKTIDWLKEIFELEE